MSDAPSALAQEIVALIRREVKPAQGELPGLRLSLPGGRAIQRVERS